MNAKAKTSLQLPSETREISFKYLKDYKPLAKKDKNEPTREPQNKDRAKPHNLSLANTS